jgi:uncharacterized protein YggE
MRSRRGVVFLSCALSISWTATAPAQVPSGERAVYGQGSVEIKRQPEFLRVEVDLLAKGKDPKEALAKLKERREAALSQLAALGADRKAIVIGEPTLSPETADPRRQMQMMVMERMRTGGRAKKPDKPKAAPVQVTANLRADLPLKASGAEELLVAAHALQEKIKAADLAGLKEIAAGSPEEQELAEEMDPEMMGYNPGETRPGEPTFLFVSKVPEEERDKALAEAFQKAKREAARLAKAAGAELGPLAQLWSTHSMGNGGEDYTNPYRYYYQYMQKPATRSGDKDDSASEAIGPQPGGVSLRIAVNASFALKTPGK